MLLKIFSCCDSSKLRRLLNANNSNEPAIIAGRIMIFLLFFICCRILFCGFCAKIHFYIFIFSLFVVILTKKRGKVFLHFVVPVEIEAVFVTR